MPRIDDVKVRRRLFLIREAESKGVKWACMRMGLHRSTFYYWKKRYDQYGEEGLKDHSRRPHRSPKKTSDTIIRLISEIREDTQRGPRTISVLLRRDHGLRIPSSTVHRVLRREGYIVSKVKQPKKLHLKRYQATKPGERIQLDIKYVPYRLRDGTRGRGYQYTHRFATAPSGSSQPLPGGGYSPGISSKNSCI